MMFALLASTSLWFAGNAVIQGMQSDLGLPETALGPVTSALQLGFIFGTLLFAILTISDRYSPSKVFFVSAMIGAFANGMLLKISGGYEIVLLLRFTTGFCLAGIYPVGMKIASDHFPQGLGKALGFLLGALVLGTASPHLIRGIMKDLPWRYVITATSALAALGGMMVLSFVKDGPNRKAAAAPDLTVFLNVFRKADFRAAAFGYFGHMWELYAFWTFVPVFIMSYAQTNNMQLPTSVLSFFIIGIGAVSCIAGGYWALRKGSAKVAVFALSVSGLLCLLSPIIFQLSLIPFLIFLFIWGLAVIADSPQFSTIIAQSVPGESVGTGLTIINSIGFAITIITIQLLNYLTTHIDVMYLFLPLTLGPVFGLISMRKLLRGDTGM
jgi:MFS family permease